MAPTIHATCLLIGAVGVLVRGPSGAGKSALAAQLVEAERAGGRYAQLVSDDRVAVAAVNGRLVARAPSEIAGRLELRGFGIVATDFETAAVVRLVVDIVDPADAERLPEPGALVTTIEGLRLARQPVCGTGWQACAAVRARILAERFGIERENPTI